MIWNRWFYLRGGMLRITIMWEVRGLRVGNIFLEVGPILWNTSPLETGMPSTSAAALTPCQPLAHILLPGSGHPWIMALATCVLETSATRHESLPAKHNNACAGHPHSFPCPYTLHPFTQQQQLNCLLAYLWTTRGFLNNPQSSLNYMDNWDCHC